MRMSLVIMAAGLGSRYGGNKQVDGIGPHGEMLMEYAIYDALRAGFGRVVFIIKPEMEELMERLCVESLRGQRTAAEEAWAPVPVGEAVEDTYFDDAVFLGDSRTDGFRLYSGLNAGTYLYATGATVESVFSKAVDTPQGRMPLLDALAKTDCGKIYVMLGINELGWVGTDTFRNQAAKMFQRIQADHPDAVVVIQSLLPVSAKQDAKGSYVNNQRIGVYNQILRELAEELELPYLDVAEAVTDEDGCLRADWTFDGVHLNKAGCQAWLEYLRTHPVTA